MPRVHRAEGLKHPYSTDVGRACRYHRTTSPSALKRTSEVSSYSGSEHGTKPMSMTTSPIRSSSPAHVTTNATDQSVPNRSARTTSAPTGTAVTSAGRVEGLISSAPHDASENRAAAIAPRARRWASCGLTTLPASRSRDSMSSRCGCLSVLGQSVRGTGQWPGPTTPACVHRAPRPSGPIRQLRSRGAEVRHC